MANKKNLLGILVMVLVFGVFAIGCATSSGSKFNFYNFGDVTEENCAYILVSPVWEEEGNVWPFSKYVKINGQGDRNQWPRSSMSFSDRKGRAIVRLTPGEHTFTLTFTRTITSVGSLSGNVLTLSEQTNTREIPANITLDVKAGKGYIFSFRTRTTGENPASPTVGEIIVTEFDDVDDGNFGNMGSILRGKLGKEVARKSETFYVTTSEM